MTVPSINQANGVAPCPCGQALDQGDRFCRACGRAIGKERWLHRPVVVLILLFFIVGPLALPLLWRSSSFSLPLKVILSFLSIAVLFWALRALSSSSSEALLQIIG